MKENLNEVLEHIVNGSFHVLQNNSSLRFFIIRGNKIIERTDLLNIIDRLKIKDGDSVEDLNEESIYQKIKPVNKIIIRGCGFDKAGHFLAKIAKKISLFKEFSDPNIVGDAMYERL